MFQHARMNWALAIERNRVPLLRILATLFALVGLDPKASAARLPVARYREVLSVLRPAEWAVRRLVVLAARGLGLVLEPVTQVERVAKCRPRRMAGRTYLGRVWFQLFDPRKRFDRQDDGQGRRAEPRIRVIDVGFDPRVPLFRQQAIPGADAMQDINAVPLLRRLAALQLALNDLPRQARRYLRWQAKPIEIRKPRLVSAVRPGAPPGYHKRRPREVDAIMRECHDLVVALRYVKPALDTS